MIKWKDLPVTARWTISSVATIMAAVAYLSTYQTDVEAIEYQVQHASEQAKSRAQQVQTQIDNYLYQSLSNDISPEQRAWLKAKIRELEATKQCILRREC